MSTLKNPFKFLDSYTKEDTEIFFGREKEVEELYQKIFNGKLLVVYGSSGTGKTSLIQCGLAGKFQESDWMPILVRRGDNINNSFEQVLKSIALTPLKEKSTFTSGLRSVYLDFFKPVYLLFDQFEELFIFGNEDEIQSFIDQLKPLLEADIPCKCIFVIRGEYLENLALFEEKLPDIFNNRVRLERMTRKNASRVVTEPSRLYNIEVEDAFVPQLLDRFGGHKATIELTYLQVFLDKLFKKAATINPEKPVFNLQLLESIGKIDDVLGEFLDEQLSKTEKPEEAMSILKAFVSGEGTKKPITLEEVNDFLNAIGSSLSKQKVEEYLRKFVDLRILKDKDENGRYELRHDALAGKIFEQISLGEKELLEARQFLMHRYGEYQNRKSLLEEKDLDYIAPFLNKLYLNEELKQFVSRSQNIVKRSKNRKRNIAIAIGVVLFSVLSGFTVYAVKQKNEALSLKAVADQKTQEALNEKEIAEKQKQMALDASQKAMSASSFAELQTKMATQQKELASQQAARAENEAKNAEIQKDMATKEQQVALEKSKEALQEKNKADSAQIIATRLRMVSLSQTLAFKSLQVKDAQLSALLAFESYRLALNNGSSLMDPQLYSAVYSAAQKVVPNFKDVIAKEKEDIYSLANTSSSYLVITSGSEGYQYNSKDNSLGRHFKLNSAPADFGGAFISKDGKFILESGNDNKGYVWDLGNEGKAPIILTGHTGLIRAAAFSGDINFFATGARDSTVIIWRNGALSNRINLSARVKALDFSPDNKNLVIGCEDGTLYVYNVSSDSKQQLSLISGVRTQAVAYSSSGKIAGAGYSNGTIELFNNSGQKIRTINESSGIVAINIDEKQNIMVVATLGKTLKIYQLSDQSLKPITIPNITSPITGLSVSSDGFAYISCADNTIRKYATNTSFFEPLLKDNISRNFTTDEWNLYIGNDIPYEKTIQN
jgi:hypothetical protein